MLHEKVGKHGTRNRGRYQVAQSELESEKIIAVICSVMDFQCLFFCSGNYMMVEKSF